MYRGMTSTSCGSTRVPRKSMNKWSRNRNRSLAKAYALSSETVMVRAAPHVETRIEFRMMRPRGI